MSRVETNVNGRGAVTIPSQMRKHLGLNAGSLVIIEEQDGTLIITPAVAVPVERYTLIRRAELLLNNAVDLEDYARVVEEVKKMGLDPDQISHEKPG